MMEALNEYGRPFHQRATEIVIPPLSPAEVADMLHLNAADAFDAYLITGGLPLICNEWRKGLSIWKFLEGTLSSSTSALIVSGERSIAAEFPPDAQARKVLTAIGSGERTFSNIGKASGGLQQTSISRSLKILTDKRIVVVELPLSTKSSKETRYRIADPYIRFWLSFLGPNLAEIDLVVADRGPVASATPGTPLVIVSRSGFNVAPTPDVRELSPEDLLNAWR